MPGPIVIRPFFVLSLYVQINVLPVNGYIVDSLPSRTVLVNCVNWSTCMCVHAFMLLYCALEFCGELLTSLSL